MKRKYGKWSMTILTGLISSLGFVSCGSCKQLTKVPETVYGPPPNVQEEMIKVVIDGKEVMMTKEQFQDYQKWKQEHEVPPLVYGPPAQFNKK